MKKKIIVVIAAISIFLLTACTSEDNNIASALPSKAGAASTEPSSGAETSLTPESDVPEVDYSFENNPSAGGSIAACGDKMFFIDYNFTGPGLFSCGIDGKNVVCLDDDEYCGRLSYSDGWLYYTRSDGIYKIKTDGNEKTKILDEDLHYAEEYVDEHEDFIKVMAMAVGKEKICYEYSEDGEQTIYVYTMNKDGTQKTKAGKLESSFEYAGIFTDGYDFYIHDEGVLKKVSGDSLTPAREIDWFNTIIDGRAYYLDAVKLNSIDIATGDVREITLEFKDEEAKIADGTILFRFHNLLIFERTYGGYGKTFAYDMKNGRTYELGEAISREFPDSELCVSDRYIAAYSYFDIYKLTITGGRLEAEKVVPEIE